MQSTGRMSVRLPSITQDFAERARAFAAIHVGTSTPSLIRNVHARVDTLSTVAGDLPVTVHDGHCGDAWICSPRTTYADCAAEESARYLPAWGAPVAARVMASTGRMLDGSGLDRAVSINNWLLSTNLYPSLADVDVAGLLAQAVTRWPEHTLWFRSLNGHHNADWLAALQAAGCRLVASRQVYLYEDFGALAKRHANLRRDLALLDKTSLQYCPDAHIGEADYARIAELYALLYIGKYSQFNPVYGEAFLRQWHRAGLLQFHGFRDERGVLQSIAGLFGHGGVVTAPIIGYNTALPQRDGLYRLATASAYRACMQDGWALNFSAGAAQFKRLRGGTPSIEYSAVYARHLPRRTRTTLAMISTATRRIGAPLLRRYQL